MLHQDTGCYYTGEGQDASECYNGSDTLLNQEVGNGDWHFQTGYGWFYDGIKLGRRGDVGFYVNEDYEVYFDNFNSTGFRFKDDVWVYCYQMNNYDHNNY